MAVWNSVCYLIANTGICPGHMAYFASQSGREAWFQGKSKYSSSDFSFIRPDKTSKSGYNAGCVNVNQPYDNTLDCDYVMFRNTDMSQRWFYGMITEREYVNPNATRVYFEIDYYSTYADIITFGKCFIERTHIPKDSDIIGANNMPEPINVETVEAPYELWNARLSGFINQLQPNAFVAYATTDITGQATEPVEVAGTPVVLTAYRMNTIDDVKVYLDAMLLASKNPLTPDSSAIENVISIQHVPTSLANYSATTVEYSDSTAFPLSPELGLGEIYNNKALQYPFVFITARAIGNDPLILKPQEFVPPEGGNIPRVNHVLQGCGGLGGGFRYIAKPAHWTTGNQNVLKALDIPDYLQMPFAADAYASWANRGGQQAGASAIMAIITSAVGVGLMATAAAPVVGAGMAVSGLGMAAQAGAQNAGAMNMPDTMIGASTSEKTAAFGLHRVAFYVHMPKENDIYAIDSFFTAFGYNVSKFDIPNPKVRSGLTYIKTRGAAVKGAMPRAGVNQVSDMLNNGVTFWNCDAGEIGRDVGANV